MNGAKPLSVHFATNEGIGSHYKGNKCDVSLEK